MNTIDPQQAARVWQRVRGEDRLSEGQLQSMVCDAVTREAAYLNLSRQLPGKSALLRSLYTGQQAHTACLKGIYTLITGNHPKVEAIPVPGRSPEAILRRLYGDSMRALADYEAKIADPEYGPVFARLADREKESCRTILELIGWLQK